MYWKKNISLILSYNFTFHFLSWLAESHIFQMFLILKIVKMFYDIILNN